MTIKINNRFEIRRDTHCWILVEHVPVDQTRRNAKRQTRESHTYHANPRQCCEAILSRTGDDCETATELQESWDRAVSEICGAVVGCLEGAQA